MKFIDVGTEAHGFIAIGAMAQGVFALGQGAMGFVAVGQLAIGVFAFGQAAVGLFSVGMGAIGLYGCVAMIGVSGRGWGLILQLIPWLGPVASPPDSVSLARVRSGVRGWVPLTLTDGRLSEGLRIDARCVKAAAEQGDGPVFAWLEHDLHGPVATRLMERRPPRWRQWRWWKIWIVQLVLLTALCFGLWVGLVETLIDVWTS